MVKNLPAKAGDVRDSGPTPGSGRSPGEGNGNPLQCSCLENPMDTKPEEEPGGPQPTRSQSRTRLSDNTSTFKYIENRI